MRYKFTLIMLGLVVLAAVIAYVFSQKPTSDEQAQQQSRALPGLSAKAVFEFVIEHDDTKIVCQRSSEDEWIITAPLPLRADKYEVEGILNKFADAERIGRPTPVGDGGQTALSEYGLDKPTRMVTFRGSGKGAPSWSLAMGKEVGIGELVHALPGDGQAAIRIKKDVADKLDVTLASLRSKKLAAPIKLEGLTRVTVEAKQWNDEPAFTVTTEKQGGTWEWAGDTRDLADGDKAEQLAKKINDHYLNESDFVCDDPSKAMDYGLDDALLTVRLLSEGMDNTFAFGHKKEGDEEVFYAMNKAEPAIVKVTKTLFEDLRVQPEKLRQRSLLALDTDSVRRVSVTTADGALVLEKKDESWQIVGEPTVGADRQAVSDMLQGLSDAEARDFLPADPQKMADCGLDETHVRKVELYGKDDKLLGQIELGASDKTPDLVYARRPQYGSVLSVERKDYLGDIMLGRLAFLDRKVFDEPQDDAVEVVLAYDNAEFRCARKDRNDAWKLKAPIEGPADAMTVSRVAGLFAPLKVKGFASESAENLAQYGLNVPRGRLKVTYRAAGAAPAEGAEGAPTRVRELLIGSESTQHPKGLFAKLADEARVFVFAAQDVDALKESPASKLISRAQDVGRMAFRWDGGALEFAKQGDTWQTASGEALSADMQTRVKDAARLLESFSGAEVAALIEAGAFAYGFDRPALTIEFKDAVAAGKKVVLGRETQDGARYAKGPASNYVLIARKWDADKLLAVVRPPAKAPAEAK